MDQKNQAIDRIKEANNILITVSANPSVDQLAACIGLTLFFNKAGKHATAVFSGAIPSTIEFLEPEKTIEKNTDSLRDFIIALDKSKADKLRYKVEDQVVRIFITPYRTSISEKDLEFSQGDFNVDVVVALGVHHQPDLDQAITAHGRILHDASIIAINVAPGGELGSVNWIDTRASSLSELAMQLASGYDQKLVDGQIATAFLTGIVAETNRFSNAKTSPETMSISATLMGLGANQQLVATKLEAPRPSTQPVPASSPAAQSVPAVPAAKSDGTLEILHDDKAGGKDTGLAKADSTTPQIHIDENGSLQMPSLNTPPAAPTVTAAGQPEQKAEISAAAGTAKPGPAQAALPSEPQGQAPLATTQQPTSVPPSGLQLPPVSDEPADTLSAVSASEPSEEPEQTAEPVLPPPTPLPEPVKQEGPHLILEPPTFNSQLTANVMPEDREPSSGDPLAPPHEAELLDREPLAQASAGAPVGRPVAPPAGDEAASGSEPNADSQPPAPAAELPTASPEPEEQTPSQVSPLAATPPAGLQLPPVQAEPPIQAGPAGGDADAAFAGAVNDLLGDSGQSVPPPAPALSAPPTLAPPSGTQDAPALLTPVQPGQDASPAMPSSGVSAASPLAADNSIKALTDTVADSGANLDSAREAVARAINNGSSALGPTQALNAQPLGSPLHEPLAVAPQPQQPVSGMIDPAAATPAFTAQPPVPPTADTGDQTASAPPVPPPMLPPVQL